MLYDFNGREIKADAPPPPERLVRWEPADRAEPEVSRGLTPTRLDQILRQANSGDAGAQAQLSLEIEEKDPDTCHALGVRRAAVTGTPWACEPADEKDAAAKRIAEEAEAMLRGIRAVTTGEAPGLDDGGIDDAIDAMMGALLPGYQCLEILWTAGGSAVDAFAPVPVSAITFRDSKEPRIATTRNANGDPLVPNKFVFHRHKARSGDIARGGLIRPLGWMHAFSLLGIKGVLRFVERYGMPFFLARLDENTWKTERQAIAALVRNFGQDGGAVVTKATEAELIAAANGQGDVYFKLIALFSEWKTKIILGQLATSGEATGLSNGGAQAAVRQDILESDCAQIERTIRRDVLRPWTLFRHGPAAPVPVFKFKAAQPEDLERKSKVMLNLSQAGLDADPEEASATFGMRLTRRPAAPPSDSMPFAATDRRAARRAVALAAQAASIKAAEAAAGTIDDDARRAWLGPVDEAIREALSPLDGLTPDADGNFPPEAEAAFKANMDRLLEARPALFERMQTAAVEDAIAAAMATGHLNGRLAAAELATQGQP
jgi:phage gp29-like protein